MNLCACIVGGSDLCTQPDPVGLHQTDAGEDYGTVGMQRSYSWIL